MNLNIDHKILKSVIRVAAGNFLEMYDFMVFGYYATAIARTFFPNTDPSLSLFLSFATFGAGFLMRPLGAIVLGAYIDQHGRRRGLILSLGLMSLGTATLALMPSYASIGIVAPLLVLCGRLLQGFSAGAELGGVSVYLSEIATPGHKGFYVSWQSASQQCAVIFAAVLGVFGWSWRVPMGVGCLIIPFLFLLRRGLAESGDFLSRPKPKTSEIFASIASQWRIVLLGVMLVTMTTVSFYLITAYTPTYGSVTLHLSSRASLVVTLCVGLSNLFWLPVMGALSDRIGRRPLLIACTALTILTAFPALSWLVTAPSFGRLLAVELLLSFLYGSYNGAMVVYLTEIMPAAVRTTGFSMAYSIATALFGGFTPAICTYLIRQTGNRAVPGLWVSFAAACGLAATLLLRKRRTILID